MDDNQIVILQTELEIAQAEIRVLRELLVNTRAVLTAALEENETLYANLGDVQAASTGLVEELRKLKAEEIVRRPNEGGEDSCG